MNSEADNNSPEITPREQLLQRIGDKLIAAREARGERIDEPARLLKLSKGNLTALESGDWSTLPDEVYALGFLRQYSQHLKVDLSHELELLKQDEYRLTRPLTFPDPPVAPSRKWAWIAGSGFVALFLIFNMFGQSPQDSSTSAPDENLAAIQPPATEPETVESSPAAAEPATAETTTPASTVTAEETTAEPSAIEKPTPVEYTLRLEAATDDVWFQLHESDDDKPGKMIREALLKKGQYALVKSSSETLWITSGNAPAMRILVDNQLLFDTKTLGGGRKIIREFRFTASSNPEQD